MYTLCAPHLQYRATGISLMGLRSYAQDHIQARTLFDTDICESNNGDSTVVTGSAMQVVLQHVDILNRKFGEHAIVLGSSLSAVKAQRKQSDSKNSIRKTQLSYTPPFTSERTWEIPLIGTVKSL
jgi:hypothetical protein